MLNYNKIINLNQQFAENHYGIKRFGNGQDFNMVLDNQEAPMRYPVMWLEDLPSPIETGLEHFAFRVWFLAQVEQLENREDDDILVNANEVKSDMKQLGIDFLSYWKQDSTYKDELRFEITTTWNYAELIQPDELTGGYFDVVFKVKQMFNRCIVPMGTIAPPDILYSDVTGNSTLMVSLVEGEDYTFQIKNVSGDLVGTWNPTTKIWTVPDSGSGTASQTFNGAAVVDQAGGTTKVITVKDTAGNNRGTKGTDTPLSLAIQIADVTQTLNGAAITSNKAETSKAITIRYANNDPVTVTTITDTETVFIGEVPDPAAPVVYDADAQAYFDLIGDVPLYAKTAWNNRVIAHKANGTWAGLTQCLPFLPSETILNPFIDAKTLTTTCTLYNAAVLLVSPYITPVVWSGSNGCNFNGDGIVRTGWNPFLNWTINSQAWSISYPNATPAVNGYSWGAFTGATESVLFYRRTLGGTLQADMNNTTITSGRIQISAAGGTRGTFLANRQSSSDYKLWKNGVQIGTTLTGVVASTLPNKQTYLNSLG